MQERELNKSGWSIQRIDKRTMDLHNYKFHPTGCIWIELPFK